jgi:hypothetical protein
VIEINSITAQLACILMKYISIWGGVDDFGSFVERLGLLDLGSSGYGILLFWAICGPGWLF